MTEPSDQFAHFTNTKLSLGEVNRAHVAEAADRRGEPSSGGGGIAVEKFEGDLINFGEAQQLFGLSAVEGFLLGV